jgi:hypothetical protein
MKLYFTLAISACISAFSLSAQTITTFTSSVKMNDSLKVVKTITSAGDITATGEVTSKDTLHAQKDVLVGGNVIVDGNMKVGGTARLGGLVLDGLSTVNPIDPCLQILMAQPVSGGSSIITLSPTQIGLIESQLDLNPCPITPVIPFTWQTYGNHVNSNNRWIGTIENFDFNIRTNNTLRMVVKNNGQIFFGSKKIIATHLHANSQFQFDGKLACKELVVVDPTKWADFVFDKNYKLMPLKEVESFYKTNAHLPSVPSEKEVKANGINTAEMDAILLQKIEELTLYIVQQQKEIETLKTLIKK